MDRIKRGLQKPIRGWVSRTTGTPFVDVRPRQRIWTEEPLKLGLIEI